MATKASKKKKNPASQAEMREAAPVLAQPAVPENLRRMREALAERHPSDAGRILAGDAAFLCNRYLQNDANREAAARLLGLEPSKCSICARSAADGECPYRVIPLNFCRNGIIAYLEGAGQSS